MTEQKITPCLWFDSNAEEAMEFYTSLFKNSRILDVRHYDEAAAKAAEMPEGSVLMGTFVLDGQEFQALNGGPAFKFTEAISLSVSCENQAEVDKYWSALTADGGEESMCGWLKDKFGLSWQIVPKRLVELLGDQDPERAGRAMQAMLEMRKLDIAALEKAAAG